MNPMLQSVPFMIVYKVFIIGAFCLVLHRLREYKLARFGLKISTAIFAVVDLWHIINI